MIRKILLAVMQPSRILPYFLRAWRRRVVRVVKTGKVYYKYQGVLYPEYLNKGDGASWISRKALEYCSGHGIDVGAGKWPLPGAIPVQEGQRQNAYNLDDFEDSSLDYVFSSHCLEHLECWPEALALWARKLKPGGALFLYLPHESMKLWRPGAPWVNNAHKWVPTDEAVSAILKENHLDVVERGPEKDEYWSFFLAARKRAA